MTRIRFPIGPLGAIFSPSALPKPLKEVLSTGERRRNGPDSPIENSKNPTPTPAPLGCISPSRSYDRLVSWWRNFDSGLNAYAVPRGANCQSRWPIVQLFPITMKRPTTRAKIKVQRRRGRLTRNFPLFYSPSPLPAGTISQRRTVHEWLSASPRARVAAQRDLIKAHCETQFASLF